MIVYYSIFLIMILCLILLYIYNDNIININNISATYATITNINTEYINTLKSCDNMYGKIQVYSNQLKYRVKINFKYNIDGNNYTGYVYVPDSNYHDYYEIKKLGKKLRQYAYIIIFYNKQNPNIHWIE